MIDALDFAADTDRAAKIPQEEQNIGSPQTLVSPTLLISFPISGRLRSSPMLSPLEWQVIPLVALPCFRF